MIIQLYTNSCFPEYNIIQPAKTSCQRLIAQLVPVRHTDGNKLTDMVPSRHLLKITKEKHSLNAKCINCNLGQQVQTLSTNAPVTIVFGSIRNSLQI